MALGAELKDFINSFGAGEKLLDFDDSKYKRLRNRLAAAQVQKAEDPEYQALDKEDKKASVALKKAQSVYYTKDDDGGLKKRRGQLLDLQIEGARRALNPPPQPVPFALPGGPAPDAQPAAPQQQSALPLDDQYTQADEDLSPDGNTAPTQFAANGGKIRAAVPVKAYADGGFVDDDGDDDDDDSESDNDNDSTTGATQNLSYLAAHDAVRDGLSYNVAQYLPASGRGGIPTPQRAAAVRAYAQGRGAATPDQMQQIFRIVDPDGKLPEAQRNLKALGGVYYYYASHGDMDAAKKAAGEMLQYYRRASQLYASFAAAADAHGHPDEAARLAMKSYAQIPDGRDLNVQRTQDGRYQYSYTDGQTGKVISQGVASPQELASAAMGVASNGFDKFILQAAGERSTRGSGTGGGVPKYAERAKVAEDVNSEAGKVGTDGKTPKYNFFGMDDAGHDVARRISEENNISISDATRLAADMFDPSKPLKMKPREDGGSDMQLPDGRSYPLSQDALRQAAAARGQIMKNQEKEAADKKAQEGRRAQAQADMDAAVEKRRSELPLTRGNPMRKAAQAERAIPIDDDDTGGSIGKRGALPVD